MNPSSGGNILGIIVLLILIIGVPLFIIILAFRTKEEKPVPARPVLSQVTERYSVPQKTDVETTVKRCPTCQSTFTDVTLQFCVLDGGPLEYVTGGRDQDETVTRIRNI